MKAVVITCSNRSAAGQRNDDSGRLIHAQLTEWGFQVADPVIVPDDIAAIQAVVARALADGARLVLTTGGTGVTPTDVTPEAVTPLLQRQLPGIAERIRSANVDKVPTAVLSRGVAGTIGDALIVTLPGSPGGVRDGLAVLAPLVHHALDQLAGGDHRPGGGVADVGGGPGLGVAKASSGPTPAGQASPSAGVLGAAPSSGFAPATGSKVKISDISEDQLDIAAHVAAVSDAGAGADVVFTGVVRDHDHGRTVRELEYSCYPTAAEVLRAVAEKIATNPDVISIAVSHRIGILKVGDVALVAAVSCAHRGAAFALCHQLVDEVKLQLPVWKRQLFSDGTDEWVNCP